jgi:hypothetical protein
MTDITVYHPPPPHPSGARTGRGATASPVHVGGGRHPAGLRAARRGPGRRAARLARRRADRDAGHLAQHPRRRPALLLPRRLRPRGAVPRPERLFLAWFGPGALGIRLLSAFLGTLAVPLTYALARRLFGPAVGLTAAALLAVSFWGLMYSRVGIRHVMTPVLALAAFYFFWQSLGLAAGERGSRARNGGRRRPPRSLGKRRVRILRCAPWLANRVCRSRPHLRMRTPPARALISPAPLRPCSPAPSQASSSASASTATSPRAARRSFRWPSWAMCCPGRAGGAAAAVARAAGHGRDGGAGGPAALCGHCRPAGGRGAGGRAGPAADRGAGRRLRPPARPRRRRPTHAPRRRRPGVAL